MMALLWLLAGFIGSGLLIKFTKDKSRKAQHNIFGVALIIAAVIYVGFALFEGTTTWLFIELCGVVLYGGMFILSKRNLPYLLAIAWLAHPVWDTALHLYGAGASFAPTWYAIMCISFDITVARYLFILVYRYKQKN